MEKKIVIRILAGIVSLVQASIKYLNGTNNLFQFGINLIKFKL